VYRIYCTFFAVISISVLFMSADAFSAVSLPSTSAEQPNILFISVDDLRPDLGSYGHPVAKTPRFDGFAETALLFEKAYTQQAVCGPSRAALLTGLRPSTTGIKRLDQTVTGTLPDTTTLNSMFKKSGYETVSVGKIYHHFDDDINGWSKAPFDSIYNFRKDRKKRGLPKGPPYAAWLSDELLPDAKNVAHAVNELDRLSKQDNPFFLAVGLHRPHLPFRAPKKFWDKYDPKSVPAPKTTKQQLGAPDWAVVAWEIWNYDNLPPKPGPMPKAEGEQLRHGYLAAISFVDGLVGQLLDKLSALDLDKNTVVVVWGDHGFKLGDHGGWSKHSNVELDIHIPLMIRVPGMKASGKRTKALVETVDIYPTLMDVAGLDQPHELEGISLLPLTNEPNQEWKEAVFAQFPRYAKHQALMGETVRTDRYRYTAWVGVRSGKIIAQELYDHKINSTESVNLAENSDYINDLKYHEKLRIMGWKNIHNEMNKKISKNLIN
jgi:arylsulfatase A-like enzyme